MRICFFAKGADAALLQDVAYYSEDIAILRELGHEVVLAAKFAQIPWSCDLYFTWWYAWGFMTLCRSLPRRTPNIMVGPLHLSDPEVGFKKRSLLRQWSIRLSLCLADAVVAVSHIEYEGLQALRARNPRMAYHSVVAPKTIKPLSQRRPVVLSIGHLDAFGIRRKRFDNVVRSIPSVLEKVPNARFVMIGRQGSGFEDLLRLTRILGVEESVEFPGRVDNAAKAEYLQSSQVLAQPACYEGFGLAQLEAMASGLPVVTTPAGAVKEVVGDCGVFCDKDAPEDIACKIVGLLQNRALWNGLSTAGRTRAIAMFSREQRRDQLSKIIAETIRNRNTIVESR